MRTAVIRACRCCGVAVSGGWWAEVPPSWDGGSIPALSVGNLHFVSVETTRDVNNLNEYGLSTVFKAV